MPILKRQRADSSGCSYTTERFSTDSVCYKRRLAKEGKVLELYCRQGGNSGWGWFKKIAEKEARKAKRAPKTPAPTTSLHLEISSDESDSEEEAFLHHPELDDFDFGVTDIELGVPDPFAILTDLLEF
jgi:hypothetical protein